MLLLACGFCALIGWQLTLPGQFAERARLQVRTGSSLREVVAAVDRYWMASAQECSRGIDSFRIVTPSLTPAGDVSITREGNTDSLSFGDKATLLSLLDARPALLTCRRLSFVFRVSGPARVWLKVEFDENGRVSRVETETD